MDRAERRYRTYKIALRRLLSMPNQGAGQILGWFRKWNATCRCSICKIEKHDDIRLQRLKDDRRNPEWDKDTE